MNTFRESYQALAKDLPAEVGRDRVEINTLDGFITSNILRPHAYRTMGATQAAFLVMGGESFLDGFTFKTSTYPLSITKMQVAFQNAPASVDLVVSDHTMHGKTGTELIEKMLRLTSDIGTSFKFIQESNAALG